MCEKISLVDDKQRRWDGDDDEHVVSSATSASSSAAQRRAPPIKSSSSLSSTGSTASSSSKSKGPPLRFLSLLWLFLCATLVTKHNDLIAVFFSFVASFLAAALLSSFGGGKGGSEKRRRRRGKRGESVIVKDLVGLLACTASLGALSGCLSGLFGLGGDEEFAALAVVTGYLAFDLWYAPLCHPPPSHLSPEVWENALTLSGFVVVLARFGSRSSEEGANNGMAQFRSHVAAWVGYKCVRLVLALSRSSSSGSSSSGFDADSAVSRVPSQPHHIQSDAAVSKKSRKVTRALSDLASEAQIPSKELLWTVHGRRYDLADFVDRHPGGRQALLLGRGRDCTALFESYHPFTERHREVLEKYRIINDDKRDTKMTKGDEDDDAQRRSDPFYEALKDRASSALIKAGLDPNTDRAATPTRALYYLTILACLLYSGRLHLRANLLGSVLFSTFGWLIGSLGHDGGHYAASRTAWINDVSVWAMSLLCNPIMWQHQHTYAHHSHTNSVEDDPDLHHFTSLLRVHRQFKREGVHGMQRYKVWVIFAYCFVVFGECVKIPLGMITTGSLYGVVEWTDRTEWSKRLGLVGHYVTYLGVVVLGPILFSQTSWYVGAACSLIHLALTGLLFAVFSQINHLNEHSLGESAERKIPAKLQNSWAARQIVTSNDFCPASPLWHVLSNGLNLQIEHHLFPGLNHCHLHLMQDEVKRTCLEWGVEYKVYDSWGELMEATLEWLNELSREVEEEGDGQDAMVQEKSMVKEGR